jgi:hypothetical protein
VEAVPEDRQQASTYRSNSGRVRPGSLGKTAIAKTRRARFTRKGTAHLELRLNMLGRRLLRCQGTLVVRPSVTILRGAGSVHPSIGPVELLRSAR